MWFRVSVLCSGRQKMVDTDGQSKRTVVVRVLRVIAMIQSMML